MVTKSMMLISLLKANGVDTTDELREKLGKKGKKISFSKYAENNFNHLSFKRHKGKRIVKQ